MACLGLTSGEDRHWSHLSCRACCSFAIQPVGPPVKRVLNLPTAPPAGGQVVNMLLATLLTLLSLYLVGGQARSGRKGLQLCRRRFWGRRLSSSVRAPASLIRLPASQIRAESRDAAGVIFRGSFVLEGWIGLRAGIILGERESKMEWFLGRTLRALFRFRQHKRGWQNDRWRKCLAICQ